MTKPTQPGYSTAALVDGTLSTKQRAEYSDSRSLSFLLSTWLARKSFERRDTISSPKTGLLYAQQTEPGALTRNASRGMSFGQLEGY